jgi:hypothetical protein
MLAAAELEYFAKLASFLIFASALFNGLILAKLNGLPGALGASASVLNRIFS